MPHETDLPCTECGSTLEERCEQRDATQSTGRSDDLTVAVCRRCGATHYPEETLAQLVQSGRSRFQGGS